MNGRFYRMTKTVESANDFTNDLLLNYYCRLGKPIWTDFRKNAFPIVAS